MRRFNQEDIRRSLGWDVLIEGLRDMFCKTCGMPARHHHDLAVPGEPDATMLLMPAWIEGEYAGVKVAMVAPGNAARNLPAVSAAYILCHGRTGEVLAVMEGGELTARRTAAASALAAGYLARRDARRLLVIGTGRLGRNLAAAHSSAHRYTQISIWGRDPEKARALARQLSAEGAPAEPVEDLPGAAANADVISCATMTTTPVLRGEWVSPGTHVDLVGSFKPSMREADDVLIQRSRIFVDTRDGALAEAGDIVQAIDNGAMSSADIVADLFDLARGQHPGRANDDEITVFKSVGAALEDLAAAILAFEQNL